MAARLDETDAEQAEAEKQAAFERKADKAVGCLSYGCIPLPIGCLPVVVAAIWAGVSLWPMA